MTPKALSFIHIAAIAIVTLACSSARHSATPSPTTQRFEVATGVFARVQEAPPVPSGSVALSDYFVFDVQEDSGVVVGLPLTTAHNSTVGLGFYSYVDGQWSGVIGAISLEEGGTILQGVFPNVPSNVIVLLDH